MNLFDIALGAISAINPNQLVTITYLGAPVTNSDGSRTPTRMIAQGYVQIQPLATGELAMVESLNQQGVHRRMYADGEIGGIIRAKNQSGSLITTQDGLVWKATDVPEDWQDQTASGWVCCVLTLQNNA